MLFLAKQNSSKDLFVTKFLDKLFVWKERYTGSQMFAPLI